MTTLVISWKPSVEVSDRVAYYVDGIAVGEGEVGFDHVLDRVRSVPDARATLSIRTGALGGGSILSSLPFRARLDELREAMGGDDRIVYDFS